MSLTLPAAAIALGYDRREEIAVAAAEPASAPWVHEAIVNENDLAARWHN